MSRCSNETLERAGVAYRRGYNDGYDGTEMGAVVKPEYIKPFADHDYKEGHAAGLNDRRWSDHYEKYGYNSGVKPDWK